VDPLKLCTNGQICPKMYHICVTCSGVTIQKASRQKFGMCAFKGWTTRSYIRASWNVSRSCTGDSVHRYSPTWIPQSVSNFVTMAYHDFPWRSQDVAKSLDSIEEGDRANQYISMWENVRHSGVVDACHWRYSEDIRDFRA
jgi:hypothetical protein